MWRTIREGLDSFVYIGHAWAAKIKESNQKVACFLTIAGPIAVDMFNSFHLIQLVEAKYETGLQKSVLHCSAYTNETWATCFQT